MLVKPFSSIRLNDTINLITKPDIKNVLKVIHSVVAKSKIYFLNHNNDSNYFETIKTSNKFVKSKILIEDNEESFYIHEQSNSNYSVTSLLVALHIKEFIEGKIKIHEQVSETKIKNMCFHFDSSKMCVEPLTLFYTEENILEEFLSKHKEIKKPIYNFVSKSQYNHKIWKISNQCEIDEIINIFLNIKNLYLADGHHRINAYKQLYLKNSNSADKGIKNGFFLANIVLKKQIILSNFCRIFSLDEKIFYNFFLTNIKSFFDIKLLREITMPQTFFTLTLLFKEKIFSLSLKEKYINKNCISSVEIFDSYILPFFNRQNLSEENENNNFFIGGEKLKKLINLRSCNDNKLWIILASPTIEDIIKVSNQNKFLPKKSTYFEPKFEHGFFTFKF